MTTAPATTPECFTSAHRPWSPRSTSDHDVSVADARARFSGIDIPATLAGMLAASATAVGLGGLVAGAGTFGHLLGLKTRSKPSLSSERDKASVVRHEEEVVPDTVVPEAGRVGVRKVVEHESVETVAPTDVEHAQFERQAPAAEDSGEVEILADGSVSIPVFEEELVIEKRLVVRERVVVRKHTVTEERRVEADLRLERVEVEADPGVEDRVDTGPEREGAVAMASMGAGGTWTRTPRRG